MGRGTDPRRARAAVALLVLCALVLRAYYVPIHLAIEEHCGAADHFVVHDEGCGGHGEHGHSDDDHQKHCSQDHDDDLIVQRPTPPDESVDLEALKPADFGVASIGLGRTLTAEAVRGPPESPPRLLPANRGPPAAV